MKNEAEIVQKHRLEKGDLIPHQDTEYKVLAELKHKVFQMENTADGRKFKMSSKDGLYAALLETKYSQRELGQDRDLEQQEGSDIAAEEAMDFQSDPSMEGLSIF